MYLTLIAVFVSAITAAIAVYILTKKSFSSLIDKMSLEKDALTGDLETAKAEADRLKALINERDLTINSLGKDLSFSRETADKVKAGCEESIARSEKLHAEALEDLRRQNAEAILSLKEHYGKVLQDMKDNNEKSLQQQIAAVKAQISTESEKVLKARQEEFTRKAEESFSTIAGDFNKNLTDMKQAFEANKKSQSDTSAELRTQIGEAVRNLKDQTESVGRKADHIASALRGQNKMQGCWGETQLNNILLAEGLVEGRDFDREETLRDEMGIVIHNEDTGKRMRPDFILHYPDNTDIIVDCKVSLNALSDWFAAESEEERNDAAGRNLKAIKAQVDNLSRKDYSSYIKSGRKSLDYTVMFIPNLNALILARQSDPHIIADAFRKNVLITSEETLMPFLRLVRTAWINFEQARNQEKIVNAARLMIERVGQFCESYASVGASLTKAVEAYQKGETKLREGGQSILHSAREVEALGVRARKALPTTSSDPGAIECARD